MDNRQHYATGSLEACCGNSRCHWVLVTAEAGSTSRQEGLQHLGLATLNALCKSWCESSSCGQKSTKQTPIRFEEERRAKPQTPVALTYALQQLSHIKRHKPERGPLGRKGLSAAESGQVSSLADTSSNFNCSFCPACTCCLCFPPHASSSLEPCQSSNSNSGG